MYINGGSEMLDLVKTTISCRIPTLLWNTTKNVANFEEITATDIVIRALKKEMKEVGNGNNSCNGFELGDRVCCTSYDNIDFTNFLVAAVDNQLGIYTHNGISDWRPLSSFKSVKKWGCV